MQLLQRCPSPARQAGSMGPQPTWQVQLLLVPSRHIEGVLQSHNITWSQGRRVAILRAVAGCRGYPKWTGPCLASIHADIVLKHTVSHARMRAGWAPALPVRSSKGYTSPQATRVPTQLSSNPPASLNSTRGRLAVVAPYCWASPVSGHICTVADAAGPLSSVSLLLPTTASRAPARLLLPLPLLSPLLLLPLPLLLPPLPRGRVG